MPSHNLERSGVRLSRLGFGCVNLTTHRRTQDALRLLGEAFDAGITHFDVARLYGLGRAEIILGDFLRTVARDRVTVATKFGLQPPATLGHRPSLVRFGKAMLHLLPGLRALAHRRLRAHTPAPRFHPHDAARSLEISLRALGSEYVDLLLLHEAQVADASGPELLDQLERERRAGRIRAYGVATHTSRLGGDLGKFPAAYAVFQFNNTALDAEMAGLSGTTDKLLITHSALAPLKTLRQAMTERDALVSEWSAKLDANLADDRILAQLLLDYALSANAHGTVLFATMRSEHLRDNIARAARAPRSSEQLALFSRYCRLLTGKTAA